MIGLIGTALGIGIMARVATGVCYAIERPYGQRPRYPRNNNYKRYPNRYNNYRKNQSQQPNPQQQSQLQPNTNPQQLPLQPQQPQEQPQSRQQPLQHKQKPRTRYNSYKPRYSYKPKPLYNKNRKQPYWKMKTI